MERWNQAVLEELQEYRRGELLRLQQLRTRLHGEDATLLQLQRSARTGEEAARTRYAMALAAACRRAGLDPAALQYRAKCPTCQDRGFVPGGLCTCVRNEAARRAYRFAGEEVSFDTFDEGVFPDEEAVYAGHTQRGYMRRLKQVLQRYCDTYPAVAHPCMVLSGNAGVGKTYLLKCMAQALGSRGFTVMFLTAYRLNETLHQGMLGKADILPLLDCDVLCIDDLGSEPMFQNSTLRGLFNLLNDRWENGRGVLISTNLTPQEIRSRYEERIYSRLSDSRYSTTIPVYGRDLRRLARPAGKEKGGESTQK